MVFGRNPADAGGPVLILRRCIGSSGALPHCAGHAWGQPRTAASTSATWPATLTGRQTRSTRPSAPISTVERMMPRKRRPEQLLAPDAVALAGVAVGVRDQRRRVRPCLARKLSVPAQAVLRHPTTTAPGAAKSGAAPRSPLPRWCRRGVVLGVEEQHHLSGGAPTASGCRRRFAGKGEVGGGVAGVDHQALISRERWYSDLRAERAIETRGRAQDDRTSEWPSRKTRREPQASRAPGGDAAARTRRADRLRIAARAVASLVIAFCVAGVRADGAAR